MPIITALEIQKKAKQRVNLFIDNSFYCGLYLETVMKQGLKKGQEISQVTLEQLNYEDQKINAREAALRLLDVRARSRDELEKRLKLKKIASDIINEVLDNLEKSNLINDEAFAKMLVQHLQSKHMGHHRMVQALRTKGLNQDLINRTMETMVDSEQAFDSCLAAAQKKVSSYQRLEPLVAKRRLTSFLLRRGFNYEDVAKVVKQLIGKGNLYPFGNE